MSMVTELGRMIEKCLTITKQETGSTLVEFAASSLILFALTFGMIDFSLLMYTRTAVQASAQEGAREAILTQDDGSLRYEDIRTAAKDKLILLDPEKAVITIDRVDSNMVQVEVAYPYEFVTPVGGLINISLPDVWNIDAVATMLIR